LKRSGGAAVETFSEVTTWKTSFRWLMRETLVSEVQAAGADLCEYVRREMARLLANPGFVDALPGFLFPDPASQLRLGVVLKRLRDLASI
jgi:hypothetical protein